MRVLFTCIILSLFPIILKSRWVSSLTTGMGYQVLVGALFLIQSAYVVYFFLTSGKRKIDARTLLFAFIFIVPPMITVIIASLTGEINYLDVVYILARFISVITFLCIPSRLHITQEGFLKFMRFLAILGLVAGLYNLIVNYRGILNILNISNPYVANFTSFYLNRNSFAQLLLFSIIANSFLWMQKQTKFGFFCYSIYIINLFSTLSRTVLACLLIFTIVLFLTYFRKRAKSSIIIFITIIGLFLFLNFYPKLNDFITDMVIRSEYGTSGRTDLWTVAIDTLNKTNWLFGIGYISSIDIIRSIGYTLNEFHSFYIETLIGGGITDLMLHIIILTFALKRILIIFKHDKKTGAIYFSAFVAFMSYALVESASFFSMGYVGTLFTIFIITLPYLYSNNFTLGTVQKNINEIDKDKEEL